MIYYMIKNNFKLMFRYTWSIAIMILGPILVIAVLASAFSGLMKSYENIDEFKVGYQLEQGSVFADAIELIKDAAKDNGILFYEYSEGNPEEILEQNDLAAFVAFTKKDYTLYRSTEYKIQGYTLDYFLNRVMQESVNATMQQQGNLESVDIVLPTKKIDFMPAINSTDYYGIIYIVYFAWCGFVCASGVLGSERKHRINRKYQVSNLTETQLYFGRLIPIALTTIAGIGFAAIVSSLMYDIHWGKPVLSALIMIVGILAASAYGLMIYSIFNNVVTTIITLFFTVWFMGFVGGSFETYLFSPLPQALKETSPIYHINRALVELSCMGHSDYVANAFLYATAVIVGCSAIAIVVANLRRRVNA